MIFLLFLVDFSLLMVIIISMNQKKGSIVNTEDKQLLIAIEKLAQKKGWNSQKLSYELGIHVNTLTNWRNGGKIASKNRVGIASLLEENDIFINQDYFTLVALERWEKLTEENKAKILENMISLISKQQ